MDPLQVHKNGKIFLLLDTEIGAVVHIASMAILPAGALSQFSLSRVMTPTSYGVDSVSRMLMSCSSALDVSGRVSHELSR